MVIKMKESWFLLQKGTDFDAMMKNHNISLIQARLMFNKDIGDDEIQEYLHGTIADLHDGMLLRGMDTAIEIIKEKIQNRKKIRIIGDYDIDGVNATYILLEGLAKVGASVDSDIPDRIQHGYGLNVELIERAMCDGVDTIITCDNGIAAAKEIEYAKSHGLTVIVTDHHEVPYEDVLEEEGVQRKFIYPQADAIVNPKQPDCPYPFKKLCGAAVAYKLVEALLDSMGQDAEDVDYLIENVAIATVGDVMDLVGENRIFVKQGLEMLKQTKNLGLESLIDVLHIDREKLAAYHIGFQIGPCMNASGRLDTAKRTLELLQTKKKSEADMLANDLKALNDSRKELTQEGVDLAVEQVESKWCRDKVLVIYLPECHESLAGIIAGRIREKYHRPTFVLTKSEQGAKGSGRSIESYHMYEELNKCKELLNRYGGHKLAAGFSLEEINIERLRSTLNHTCGLSEDDLACKVNIDLEVPMPYITEELIEQLTVLEPYGKGNEKPLFAMRDLRFSSIKVVGVNQNVVKLQLKDKMGNQMDAVYFGNISNLEECVLETYDLQTWKRIKEGREEKVRFSITYYPGINTYKEYRNIQLTIKNIKCS